VSKHAEDLCDRPTAVTSLIGNTPLVEIRSWKNELRPSVRGIESGALRPGKTIIDSTSGNTGIALAMIGAALGYPVKLVMPANVSQERKRIIGAYGAEIVFSSGLEGSDGALLMCREIYEANRDAYFKPDQYFNEANPEAHFLTTGPEIWEQTEGQITHFVGSIGTGGTIMGTGRYLKGRNRNVEVIAVEPDDAFHGIEGLKHMESSIVPGIYKEHELDRKVGVATDDAYDMVHQLARSEGLLVGQSSGAAMVGALNVARPLERGCVVVLFPDFGDRYLSTNVWMATR
jgi:cysteine synthase B